MNPFIPSCFCDDSLACALSNMYHHSDGEDSSVVREAN